MLITRCVDNLHSARRRVAKAKRRAPHLARCSDAAVGVLGCEHVESQDVVGRRTIPESNFSHENGGGNIVRGGGARAAQHTVAVGIAITAATHGRQAQLRVHLFG